MKIKKLLLPMENHYYASAVLVDFIREGFLFIPDRNKFTIKTVSCKEKTRLKNPQNLRGDYVHMYQVEPRETKRRFFLDYWGKRGYNTK